MIAEPWVKLEDFRPGHATEGSIFDADGNLLLCERERPWSQIVKVTPRREEVGSLAPREFLHGWTCRP